VYGKCADSKEPRFHASANSGQESSLGSPGRALREGLRAHTRKAFQVNDQWCLIPVREFAKYSRVGVRSPWE
jgi:hypothetical protein